MANLKHSCDSCSSDFTILYDERNTESDPTYCPFCGEYLILFSDDYDTEDDE